MTLQTLTCTSGLGFLRACPPTHGPFSVEDKHGAIGCFCFLAVMVILHGVLFHHGRCSTACLLANPSSQERRAQSPRRGSLCKVTMPKHDIRPLPSSHRIFLPVPWLPKRRDEKRKRKQPGDCHTHSPFGEPRCHHTPSTPHTIKTTAHPEYFSAIDA